MELGRRRGRPNGWVLGSTCHVFYGLTMVFEAHVGLSAACASNTIVGCADIVGSGLDWNRFGPKNQTKCVQIPFFIFAFFCEIYAPCCAGILFKCDRHGLNIKKSSHFFSTHFPFTLGRLFFSTLLCLVQRLSCCWLLSPHKKKKRVNSTDRLYIYISFVD